MNSHTVSARMRRAGVTIAAAILIASALFLLLSFIFSERAHADSAPTMTFASPLYNNVPEGPVGTNVFVGATSGWTPGAQLQLGILPAGQNCSVAQTTAVPVSLAYPVTISNNGSFSAAFIWPSSANQSGAYNVCGFEQGSGSQIGSTIAPFYVLSSSSGLPSAAPSVNITFSQASTGQTITVTGANWLPVQPVDLRLKSSSSVNQSDQGTDLQKITPSSDGTFSAQVTLPTDIINQNYILAEAGTPVNLLQAGGPSFDQYPLTAQTAPFTIALAPTPTTAVTPVPTATQAVVPTVAPPSTTSTGGGNSKLFIALLGLIAVVLLFAGVVVAFLALRSKPQNGQSAQTDWQDSNNWQNRSYDPWAEPEATPWSTPSGKPWSGTRTSKTLRPSKPVSADSSFDEDWDDPYRTRMGEPFQQQGQQGQQTQPPQPPPQQNNYQRNNNQDTIEDTNPHWQ